MRAKIFALACIAFPIIAAAEPPLTLNDALRRFREHGFDLILADAAVAGAQADVTSAGAIANPQLAAARGNNYTLTDNAALSDTLLGKRRLRVAIARAALDVSKRSRADIERTLEATVKQQVLQAELAKESLANAREAQRIAATTQDLVNKRYAAGAVSEADVARADVQKLEADQAVDVAVQSLDSAKAELAYLLGFGDTPADLDVAGDLLEPGHIAVSRESLLAEAIARRPDLAEVDARIAGAQSTLALAKRQRVPDVFPVVGRSTIGVAFNVPIFYRNAGEIARANADLTAQRTARAKVDAQIAADVNSAYASFRTSADRTARMQQSLLARAARARDLVRLQYEKGAASLFEFLDAQRTYLATQSESLQTLNDYWTAVFQLEQAVGTELR